MKEAIVSPEIKVEIIDSPIPKPNADQVLIKVIVSGSNPKDWKRPALFKKAYNSGDDFAGIVESVGDNITEFKAGDRVAGCHEMGAPNGSFAEYTIAWAASTFHIPKKISFEEASTIPLSAMTAAIGLYKGLKLPMPWQPTLTPTPLIVYGAAGAVGAFVIKLAQVSNIHPIIAVAGNGAQFVESLLTRSKGDAIVDYRNGDAAVVSGIKDALEKAGATDVKYAYDAVSEKHSYQNICEVLGKDGKIILVLPGRPYKEIPEHIEKYIMDFGEVYKAIDPESPEGQAGIATGTKELSYVFFRLFSRGLEAGWLKPHPTQVIPGGLGGIEEGLNLLKDGKVSARKLVFCIDEIDNSHN